MGRPAKSIKELKESGSYRPSVHGSDDSHPVVKVERPHCPVFVPDAALQYFTEIVGYGVDMDIIGKADSMIIGLLSNEMSEWTELNDAVKVEGYIVKMPTATGFMQEVINPKLKIRDDKLKVILKMLGELGMSPAARSKVTVNESSQKSKSALGEFLSAIK